MVPFSGISSSDLLVKAMGVAQDNHRLIANNIANVDTPGYNPARLDFQASLRKALMGQGGITLRTTRPGHIEGGEQTGLKLDALVQTSKNDRNKVDIEEEIADLAENTGKFNVYGSILVKQFQMAKSMLQNTR
jgi:flagellar basal-body rod protein FlgB